MGLAIPALAEDQIVKTDGSAIPGQITGVSSGQVGITMHMPNGQLAKSIVYLSDVKSVTMDPPPEMTQLKGATPATVVATLQPLIQQYSGLPASWVIDAMEQVADAFNAQGQSTKAEAIYTQMDKLYHNTPFQSAATAGIAKLDLDAGKVDEAVDLVKPLIDKANQNFAPSPMEGRLYANAFLVYGQALQDQKQYPQALEAYLTVKTMFNQDPALVDQADQLAKALRQQDPDVSVD